MRESCIDILQRMELDNVDRAIIVHLGRDARLPNVALADLVGLTPAPCLRRVQRLEAAGVILGYEAKIDPAAVGQGFEVLLDVELTAFDLGSVQRFESALVEMPEVIELYRLFGSPDYFVRIAVASLSEYEQFLTTRVLIIPGVAKVSSRFAMKVLKSLRPLSGQ